MECNCNNNNSNGGVIPWVRGNRLPLIICVYENVVTQEQVGDSTLTVNEMTRVPYTIQDNDTVTVIMKSGFRQVEMPFTTDGNKVMVTDNGELPTGAYTVEVIIEQGNGARGRWQETRQVRIYENTSEAQLGEMYSIDADLFFYAKGDTGTGIADITNNPDGTLTITMTDGTSYVTEALKGDKGDKGDTGERGVSIVEFDVTGQTDVSVIYTVTFSDDTTQDISVPKGPQGDTGLTGNGISTTTLNSDYTLTIAYTDGTTYTTPSIRGAQGAQGVSVIGFTQTGETATNTMYNLVFSDGRTQSVAIPKGVKGDKGDTGNPGPQGAQGPKGDTVIIGDEQTYTLYGVTGQNSDGAMTQKAVTDALDEMSQVIDGAVQKEAYKEIDNSNYVNYGEKYIQYSTGAIIGSGNYISYKISNNNYKRIIARLGDNDTNDGIIAFYNTSEPSTEGYMNSYSIASNGSYRDVDISIPEGCLCIIISYRQSYSESYFRVYETIMVTNLTSGNYKQFVATDKTLSEIDTPADANAVGAALRGVPNYTISGNTCNSKELIPVVGGSKIYWTSGVSDQSLTLHVYNSSKAQIDTWKATSSTRDFTLTAQSAYVDCPFRYGTVGAGIKDNNGNVLFAPTDTYGKLIPEIDDTLKVEGAAADSKAAGDKISALGSELKTSILWGKSITRYGNIIDRESTFVTDFVPVTAEQITWVYGETSSATYGDNGSICLYDENKVRYDYYNPVTISGGSGKVFTPARKGYVRATFYNVNLDDRVITKTTKGDVFKIPLAETINILSKEVANMNVAPSVIQTQVIGHGQDVRDGYPKDSMPLFRHLYYDKGLKFLEVDVQVTSDGIAVCSHDTTINAEARNPDGSAISGTITISQHTYEELNQYDYGIKRGEQFRGLGLLKFEDFIIFCKRRNILVWIDKAMGNNSIINAAYSVLTSQGYFWNVFWESVSAVYPRINPIINVSSTSEIDNVIKANYTGKNRIGVMFGQNSTAYSTIKPLANYAYKMNASSFAFTYTSSEEVSNLMDAGVQGIIAENVTNDVI